MISSLLPLAIQSLMEELVAQPLPLSGAPGNFTRVTSRIRSSPHPEVLILQKTCYAPPPPVLPTTHRVAHDPPVHPLPLPLPYSADLGVETTPVKEPTMSLLHLPGRPLTIVDFPPSQTPPEEDLPSLTPEDAPPYQRRFLPQPLTLPVDESRCPPSAFGHLPLPENGLVQNGTSNFCQCTRGLCVMISNPCTARLDHSPSSRPYLVR